MHYSSPNISATITPHGLNDQPIRSSKSVKSLAKVFCLLFVVSFAINSAYAVQHFDHIIIVIQENRTPDNLFQGLLAWPGINHANYNIATSGVNSFGQTIPLTPYQLAACFDPRHSHDPAWLYMWNNGDMHGAPTLCR